MTIKAKKIIYTEYPDSNDKFYYEVVGCDVCGQYRAFYENNLGCNTHSMPLDFKIYRGKEDYHTLVRKVGQVNE